MSTELEIRLVRSLSGRIPGHRRVAEALGLRRLNQVVRRPATPEVRGMVRKIGYLLEVKETGK